MSQTNIAIFENNDAYRNSLALYFLECPDIVVSATYSDGKNAAQRIADSGAELVLMDIDMPGVNGIEATREIKQHHPATQVLILTVFDENERVFDAICAGADGYILKSSPPHEIVRAIQDCMNGGSPISASIARKVLQLFAHPALRPAATPQLPVLTDKEKLVLLQLVEGDSYKMIAEHLNISLDTVRFHIRNIYQKLHVNSATEAVSLALRRRLL